MPIDTDYFFIKIGRYAHMKRLIEEGMLYCNTFQYFVNSNAEGIADKFETTYNLNTYEQGLLNIKSKSGPEWEASIKVTPTNPIRIRERYTGAVGNLFSLYSFKHSDKTPNIEYNPLSEFSLGESDTVVIILDIHEFIRRVNTALTQNNLTFKHDFCKYLDLSTFSGSRSPFMKDISYSHQNEFRFYIHHNIEQPYELFIGNISDIASLIGLSDFTITITD